MVLLALFLSFQANSQTNPSHYKITIENKSMETKPATQNTGASGKYAYAVNKNLQIMKEKAEAANKIYKKICIVRNKNSLNIDIKFFIKDSCAGSDANNTHIIYCKNHRADAYAKSLGTQFEKAVTEKKTTDTTMGYYFDKVVGSIIDNLSAQYRSDCVNRIDGV